MSNKYIEILSHQGAGNLAPENTMAGLKLCIDMGVDYIELDVRRSSDGIMYNMHDETVDRTTNGRGILNRLSSSEIDLLDAGKKYSDSFSGEYIPRIEQILSEIRGKIKVFFDVKDADLSELVSMVYKYKLENDCFFWFSENEKALLLKKEAPGLALKINASTEDEIIMARDIYNAEIIECDYDCFSFSLAEKCHELGLKFMLRYDGADEKVFRKIVESKTDIINIDYPDIFTAMRDGYQRES